MNYLIIAFVIAAGHRLYSHIRNIPGRSPLVVALACLPLLTACGDGEDESEVRPESTASSSSSSSTNNDLCMLAILFLADPNTVCPSSTSTSSSPVSPMPPPPTSPPPGGTIHILGNVEHEPNDDLMNANSVSFAQSDERVGFMVDGNINNLGDIHDSFTFARPRSANYNIELCPPGEMICEMTLPIDTETAFFEVLDQSGRILKSSASDGSNFGKMSIEAGMVYYVRVVAGDTMGGTVGYTLTAYETD